MTGKIDDIDALVADLMLLGWEKTDEGFGEFVLTKDHEETTLFGSRMWDEIAFAEEGLSIRSLIDSNVAATIIPHRRLFPLYEPLLSALPVIVRHTVLVPLTPTEGEVQ